MENKSIYDELSELEKEMSGNLANTSIDTPSPDTNLPDESTVDSSKVTDSPDSDQPKEVKDDSVTDNEKQDKPTETPKADGDKPKEPTTVDVDKVVDEWDSVEKPKDTDTKPTDVDFSDVAKALGETEIKTKDDLVKVVSEYKNKAEDLEKRVNSIPEDLNKAIEIANLGGDYKEYLGVSQTDWSKEDPVSLYENYVIDNSADKDGNIDVEKVNEFLDNLSDIEKEIRGRDLQRQYINYQANAKKSLEAEAKQKRAAFESDVKSVISKTEDIAGFKLAPIHKDQLYQEVVSGNDLKFNSVEERIFTAFLRKHFRTIDSFRKTQIRNATLREVLDEAQMPNLKATTEPANPGAANKKYSYDDMITDLETKKL